MLKLSLVKSLIILLFIASFFGFTNETLQKKVIRNKQFDIHFYVSLKEKSTKNDCDYYWYRSGEIHSSFGDAGGYLLHDSYLKYYTNNQLAEKGKFHYGLKKGPWRQWHVNGNLLEETNWINGKKNGPSSLYNEQGELVRTGSYRYGVKNSIWIDHISKDTLWYKKGKAFNERPREVKKRQDSLAGKRSLWQRLFQKKDSVAKEKKPVKNNTTKSKNVEKESFFKKLFKSIFGKREKNKPPKKTTK